LDNYQRALADDLANRVRKEWLRSRVQQIHERITVHEVLRRHGIDLKTDGEEQFSCPFHGEDHKPSARVYPADGTQRSGAWCFVCRERWDAITLWRKYAGGSFFETLNQIEHAFGIETPETPQGSPAERSADPRSELLNQLLETCEARLTTAREVYRARKDLTGFLSAGSLLDKIRYRSSRGQDLDQAIAMTRQLIDKLGERIRCHDV